MRKNHIKDGQLHRNEDLNNQAFYKYFHLLREIAISSFTWENLPKTCDARYLESILFYNNCAIFFKDDILGFLTLQAMLNGKWNVYNNPVDRIAFATNGYQKKLNEKNSVIIYNNLSREPIYNILLNYAQRLANIDRIIDVNVNAQKTPILIKCAENQRLTMQNVFSQYDGNNPAIFASKAFDDSPFQTLTAGAPYVSDKLYSLKTNILNEALTYLGVDNIENKKERVITAEAAQQQGDTLIYRESRLKARQLAVEEINNMFDLNIKCYYSKDKDTEDNQINTIKYNSLKNSNIVLGDGDVEDKKETSKEKER